MPCKLNAESERRNGIKEKAAINKKDATQIKVKTFVLNFPD